MGWGTEFTSNVYLSREIYDSKSSLQDAIDDGHKEIERQKQLLMVMIGCGDVRTLMTTTTITRDNVSRTDYEQDPLYFITNTVNEIIEEITSITYKNALRDLLLEDWDEYARSRDGLIEQNESTDVSK